METSAPSTQIWRFGVFEVDAQREEIRRAGVPVKLREQSFRILLLLLEHANELVTREELRKALWPADTYVDFEHSLNAAVMKLREALGDPAEKPVYIETIPKRGYRFIAPLVAVQNDANVAIAEQGSTLLVEASATAESPGVQARSCWWLRRWITFGALCALAVMTATVWNLSRPLPAPRITDFVQLTHDGRLKEVAAADENRVYVNLYDPDGVAEVSLAGGDLIPSPIALPGEERPVAGMLPNNYPFLYDLSRDGSSFLAAGPGYSLWSVGITGNPVRHLGTAESAAWSPDGKSVVYSWRGEVWLMAGDGSDKRLLVPNAKFPDGSIPHVKIPGGPPSNSDLAWSPDSRTIRFTRNHTLWEMTAAGSNIHPLLPGWQPSSWKCCGRWTPDQAFFVFLVGQPNVLHEPEFLPHFAGNQLWALDERSRGLGRTSKKPIQLTTGPIRWARPVPSRDGKHLFARGVILKGELVRYDRELHRWGPFLGGGSREFVSFSRDRKSVAYVTFPDGILWRSNLDGSGAVRLTDPPFAVRSTEWSPDGTQILICAQRSNDKVAMYLVPAQGGPPQRLILNDVEEESDPQWSPDGESVVYTSASENQQEFKVKILDVATHKVRTLPGSGEEFSTRWSPDGRYIAALTISDFRLRIFDLVSQRWIPLGHGGADFPNWSRDGSWIYFMDGPEYPTVHIRRVSVRGMPSELLTSSTALLSIGTYGAWFGLDPDDNPLSLRDETSDEIYALTLERR